MMGLFVFVFYFVFLFVFHFVFQFVFVFLFVGSVGTCSQVTGFTGMRVTTTVTIATAPTLAVRLYSKLLGPSKKAF